MIETESLLKERKNQIKKMAKKKPMFGVNNYHKRTPRKRPGRIRKKMGPGQKRPKKYRGQGRQCFETYNDHINVFNFWWRHQVRYV